jgi:hypothetical protein
MKQNTKCETCLFADTYDSPSPCQHNIIDHIETIKTLEVVNNYYVIQDYTCKMGFSKKAFESNSDKYSLDAIKQEILKNACIKYYLVMDITDSSEEEIEHICKQINALQIPPKYISFLIKNETNKKMVKYLNQGKITNTEWKAHGFLAEMEHIQAINVALDTNLKKNNSQLLLFYDKKNIDDLDNDINDINTIINVEQRPFHMLRKNGTEEDRVEGLLMSFEGYSFLKGRYYDIMEEIKNMEDMIVLKYGKN